MNILVLTFSTIIARQIEAALAEVSLIQINACRARRTRIVFAIDDIFFAILSCVSGWTMTSVRWSIINTSCAILTNIIFARIKLILTSNASKIFGT
jgi:hypothetical protein